MRFLLLFFVLLGTTTAFSQKRIELLTIESVRNLDHENISNVTLGKEEELMLDKAGDVLFEFRTSDFPLQEIDSFTVTVGDEKQVFRLLGPFLVKNIEKESEINVVMYDKGDTLSFLASDAKMLSAKIKVHKRPVFVKDSITFGILAIVLALIFYTANLQQSGWKKFYNIIPALLLCYLVPGLLSTFGIISAEYSGLYGTVKTYLLPAALILMSISIDFKGILNLGPKALIMFFTATAGIIIGGPVAIWVYSMIDPAVVGGTGDQAVWKGMSTLAGSWIGGGANQTAMLELYGYKRSLFGKMIVVDIVVAQLWMIFLLWGAARAHVFDKWLKADVSAIEDLKTRMENYEAQNSRKPTFRDYMVILGLTFGLVSLAHLLSGYLGPFFLDLWGKSSPLASNFFWLVLICTIGALIYAGTSIRKFEGAGASKIGSVFIYILVAVIGMEMDFRKALEEPQLILVGIIWMSVHAGLLFLVAKWIRAPFFFLAVGSKANVGGAASAPVVAAAFHPSLASVGVLLAVLGYAIGSIGAILCAEMMTVVAP